MIECSKNITRENLEDTFFDTNDTNKTNKNKITNKNIRLYNKDELLTIDNLDLYPIYGKELLGQGSYNMVKEVSLSKKCREKDKVAVRIRKLRVDTDIMTTNNSSPYTYILTRLIEKSIENIVDLSNKHLHPKVYEIKVLEKKEEKDNQYYLVIVMEKYQTSLHKFIKMYRGSFMNDINKFSGSVDSCLEYSYNKHKNIQFKNSTILIKLIQKTIKLIEDVADIGYFCYDVKPANFVVNYDINKQTIDIKIIDVDADFCVKGMYSDNKKYTTLSVTRSELYKTVMLSLLAGHLNKYNQFNYLSPYFIAWDHLTNNNDNKIPFSIKISNLFYIIDTANGDYYFKDELSSMIEHYFKIKDNFRKFSGYLRYLPQIDRKLLGFCIKGLILTKDTINNKVVVVNYDDLIKEEMNKQKRIESLEIPSEEVVVVSKNQIAESKNNDNYVPEYKEEIPIAPDTPDFNELKQKAQLESKKDLITKQDMAESKLGGKNKRRKSMKKKKSMKKRK